jgi:hypothetical protein
MTKSRYSKREPIKTRSFGIACDCKELKIMSNKNFDSSIVCTVQEGTELEISEDGKEFTKVVTPFGAEGYVQKKYVKEK